MPDADVALAKAVGNLEAQVRELIHDNNNRAQRDESVARSLVKLEDLPEKIEKMDERIDRRLKALETDHIRRDQTANIGVLILKSPLIGWAIGVFSAIAAFLFGRHTG